MGKQESDNTSLLDWASGQTGHKIYNPDTNTSGTGYGPDRETARDNAEKDLAAQEIAQRAQEIIDQKK